MNGEKTMSLIPAHAIIGTDDAARPCILEVRLADKVSGCRILPDGSFETFGSYTPDAAAKVFWDSMGKEFLIQISDLWKE
jgi:hypothetical protein